MPLSRLLTAFVLAAMAAVTADAATVTLDIFYPEELVALNRSAKEGFEDVVLTGNFMEPYFIMFVHFDICCFICSSFNFPKYTLQCNLTIPHT
jgi:hypothetical protein